MNNDQKTILIIDDEITNITALTVILRSEYTVYSEDCGKDGIIAAEKYMPDIILLDIVMPEMDGYETITRLKNIKNVKDIPVIFISALDSEIDEEVGLRLGAVDYISKPFFASIVKFRIKIQMKLLAELNKIKKEKNDLLTIIGHEICNPVNKIMDMTSTGINAHNIEQKNHTFDKIRDTSSHLLDVINNALDMAKKGD
jgi:DNA-binding response OmpR family regulator